MMCNCDKRSFKNKSFVQLLLLKRPVKSFGYNNTKYRNYFSSPYFFVKVFFFLISHNRWCPSWLQHAFLVQSTEFPPLTQIPLHLLRTPKSHYRIQFPQREGRCHHVGLKPLSTNTGPALCFSTWKVYQSEMTLKYSKVLTVLPDQKLSYHIVSGLTSLR